MPTTTQGQSFPVPVLGDDPNIPEDLLNLANAIEKRVMGVYQTIADRDTRNPAPQEGQVAFLKDTDTFTYFNGSTWVDMYTKPPQFHHGTTVPNNALGADGDVYFMIG